MARRESPAWHALLAEAERFEAAARWLRHNGHYPRTVAWCRRRARDLRRRASSLSGAAR